MAAAGQATSRASARWSRTRIALAVALARTQGADLAGLTTVNIDFVRHYRPQTNVLVRPVAGSGTGISLVGHHEILIPLLAAAVIETAAAD